MATNQYINKVIVGTETKLDLSADTITPDKLASGITAHDKSGAPITGTNTYDVDSTDATAAVAEVLEGKTFYARGQKMTGTMPNNGKQDGTITTKAQQISVAQGYHDGSGKVQISSTEQAKIIAGNIKQGITILGVEGSLEPSSDVKAHAKSVTPTFAEQVVLPDDGYDYLSQVTVAAIPVTETDNSAGGVTLKIGA
ncbi:MAG: hypothetical protein ACI4XJ_08905 [Eubacteriales bacterium]